MIRYYSYKLKVKEEAYINDKVNDQYEKFM